MKSKRSRFPCDAPPLDVRRGGPAEWFPVKFNYKPRTCGEQYLRNVRFGAKTQFEPPNGPRLFSSDPRSNNGSTRFRNPLSRSVIPGTSFGEVTPAQLHVRPGSGTTSPGGKGRPMPRPPAPTSRWHLWQLGHVRT